MAESTQSFEGLAALKPETPQAPKYVQKLDKSGRAYATGKRKNAVARVWIKPGAGKITVNPQGRRVLRPSGASHADQSAARRVQPQRPVRHHLLGVGPVSYTHLTLPTKA